MRIDELMHLKGISCVLYNANTQQNDPIIIIFIRENNGWSSW